MECKECKMYNFIFCVSCSIHVFIHQEIMKNKAGLRIETAGQLGSLCCTIHQNPLVRLSSLKTQTQREEASGPATESIVAQRVDMWVIRYPVVRPLASVHEPLCKLISIDCSWNFFLHSSDANTLLLHNNSRFDVAHVDNF